MRSNITSYNIGIFSEFVACLYLRLHGFKILKQRYVTGKNTGRAEIDVIAKRKDLIIFVEVKRRKDLITGLEAVTPVQTNRLRRAAETYLAQKRWKGDARFDILVVMPHKIQWIKSAI